MYDMIEISNGTASLGFYFSYHEPKSRAVLFWPILELLKRQLATTRTRSVAMNYYDNTIIAAVPQPESALSFTTSWKIGIRNHEEHCSG
jgi:hypothetical protein